jgi:hypothetical protein
MNPFTNPQGLMNIFKKKSFMGMNKDKKETASYSRMMENRISKRRAKNKIARKTRKNQISKKGPGRSKRRFLK